VDDVDLPVPAAPYLVPSPAPDLLVSMPAPDASRARERRRAMRTRGPPHECRDVAAVAMCTASPASLREALESPESAKWQQKHPAAQGCTDDGTLVILPVQIPISWIDILAYCTDRFTDVTAAGHGQRDGIFACTWHLAILPTSLPPGHNAIDCRWIYALKQNADGAVTRYKARLVAKGLSQRAGDDYCDVYAPVSQMKTLQVFLSMAAALDLEIHQLDFKTAFLHGSIEEELYMKQPPGYVCSDSSIVCTLNKALYGLKQASRQWHEKVKDVLVGESFRPSDADPCLFVWNKEGVVFFILGHCVYDMLLACKNLDILSSVKSHWSNIFAACDPGELKCFLNLSGGPGPGR
jgi:hypothetical protein